MTSAASLCVDVPDYFTDDAASRSSAEHNREQHAQAIDLHDESLSTSMCEEIVGTSDAICRLTAQVMRVAPSDATVLITGESGTGKELIARAIHRKSRGSQSTFARMNCAVTPSTLIAAELFGYEKGSFTSANQRHAGRFEVANRGTIFLDEIGDMPAEALPSAVRSEKFRLDLFYRLNVFPIHVPLLRDRPEDILLLAKYFIRRYAAKAAKRIRWMEKRTAELLEGYDWPGNIRELQNVIERAMILCDSDTFSVERSWLRPESDRDAGLRPSLSHHQREIIEAASPTLTAASREWTVPSRSSGSREQPWSRRLGSSILTSIVIGRETATSDRRCDTLIRVPLQLFTTT